MERKIWTEEELRNLGVLSEEEISRIMLEQKERQEILAGNIVSMYDEPRVKKNTSDKRILTSNDITTFDQLKTYSNGDVIELPSFINGQKFIARVKRPSLMKLAKNGKIPNSLLSKATDLFAKGTSAMVGDDKSTLTEMYDVMRVICEAALVEPTLKDVEDAGLDLSDEQMIAIFSYTQEGIKALENFR